MRAAAVFLCFVYSASAAVLPLGTKEDDSANLTTVDYAQKYGYPAETYQVQTEDGYILTLHRIPYGRKCAAVNSKGVILVQHGLLASSFDWVVMGPDTALAFVLADRCYDVWMGNNRGNFYSRKHAYLDPDKDSDKFWNFSWHEMGQYDLPVMIDFILHTTGKSDIFYVGHSEGTTQFFIFNELHPEYDQKVKAMFAMAPIAYLGHTQSALLKLIALFETELNWIAQFIGMNEFLPTDGLISQIGEQACRDTHPGLEQLCGNILFLGCGFDSEQLNSSALATIMAHTPAGAATKQLVHYGQSINSGKFRQYDHGAIENMIIYGSLEPPKYQLEKVTIPIHLIFSANDWLAATKDVDKLISELGNLAGQHFVPFEKFNHLDYMWAIDGPELVYNPMIDIMDKLL